MNEHSAGSLVNGNTGLLSETEEPPGTGLIQQASLNSTGNLPPVFVPGRLPERRRHPVWSNVSDQLWDDWRWQRQHAIRTTAQLAELIPMTPEHRAALEALDAKFRMAIPPYYFSLIDLENPFDPIRLQAVPDPREDDNHSGVELDDPLEEDKDSPVPGLTHRYPDRALLLSTPVCSMYCRFCTRKRVTMDREGWDGPSRDEQRMIDYVRNTQAIRDVILSGGDPLTLPVSKLKWFIESLAEIDHVDMIRLGTRVPVTLPQRLYDPALIDLLQSVGKIWIQTHFNHPVEITPEASRAIRLLVNAGMPVNNHAVLLKGVNDSVQTMRDLVCGLLKIKVRPYYLFHCDPVTGAGHFRTSVWRGMEIMEGLRGHVSGLGVPTYVVDGLHGAGKIPVMPNYLISASENAVVLRNYEGLIFRYAPEDKESGDRPVEAVGVSGVLSGGGKPLVPEGNRRLARRRRKAIVEIDEMLTDLVANGGAAASTATNKTNGMPAKPIVSSGKTNGHANGQIANGHANGKTNGASKSNGHANGSAIAADGDSHFNGKSASAAAKPKTVVAKSKTVKLNVPAKLKTDLLRQPAVARKRASGIRNAKPNGLPDNSDAP